MWLLLRVVTSPALVLTRQMKIGSLNPNVGSEERRDKESLTGLVVIACRLLSLSPCHGTLSRETRRRFEVTRVRPPSSIDSQDIRHLATVTCSHAILPCFAHSCCRYCRCYVRIGQGAFQGLEQRQKSAQPGTPTGSCVPKCRDYQHHCHRQPPRYRLLFKSDYRGRYLLLSRPV